MNEPQFVWTEELVKEFFEWQFNNIIVSQSQITAADLIHKFIEYKQQEPEQGMCFILYEDFSFYKKPITVVSDDVKNYPNCKVFTTKRDLDVYLHYNKPCLSLQEIIDNTSQLDGRDYAKITDLVNIKLRNK
jgi:hypothetical protein